MSDDETIGIGWITNDKNLIERRGHSRGRSIERMAMIYFDGLLGNGLQRLSMGFEDFDIGTTNHVDRRMKAEFSTGRST